MNTHQPPILYHTSPADFAQGVDATCSSPYPYSLPRRGIASHTSPRMDPIHSFDRGIAQHAPSRTRTQRLRLAPTAALGTAAGFSSIFSWNSSILSAYWWPRLMRSIFAFLPVSEHTFMQKS